MKKLLILTLTLILTLSFVSCNKNGNESSDNDFDIILSDANTYMPISVENPSVSYFLAYGLLSGKFDNPNHSLDEVYEKPAISNILDAIAYQKNGTNNLKEFKIALDAELKKENSNLKNVIDAIHYSYDINPSIYTKTPNGTIIKSDSKEIIQRLYFKCLLGMATGGSSLNALYEDMENIYLPDLTLWQEIPAEVKNDNEVSSIVKSQYEMLHGSWPEKHDEIVLILDKNNEISDFTLYALGLMSESELDDIVESFINKTPLPDSNQAKWRYEDLIYNKQTNTGLTFKTILPSDLFVADENGIYRDMSGTFKMHMLYDNALALKVTGIVRPTAEANHSILDGSIGYTSALTKYIIENSLKSDVVVAQLANPYVDVFTGLPFKETVSKLSHSEKMEILLNYANALSTEDKAQLYKGILCIDAELTNLDTALDHTKQQLLDLINNTPASERAEMLSSLISFFGIDDADDSFVDEYFANLEPNAIVLLLSPYIEEGCRQSIHQSVINNIESSGITDEKMAESISGLLSAAQNDAQKVNAYYDSLTEFSDSSYEDNLSKMGCTDIDSPKSIAIYSLTKNGKIAIEEFINKYNSSVARKNIVMIVKNYIDQ